MARRFAGLRTQSCNAQSHRACNSVSLGELEATGLPESSGDKMQKVAAVALSIPFAFFFVSIPVALGPGFHLTPLFAYAAEQKAKASKTILQTEKKVQVCTGMKPTVETGEASWYGHEHEGKKTASGEIFDPNASTAAHPTLPLGTEIDVTNLENGKETTLTVNDRGPYINGRVLDVSKKGAHDLGFVEDGLAEVQIVAKNMPQTTIQATTQKTSVQDPQTGC
jgi:rare lipoprotein A (peptidoglycan hydrolase)